MSETEAGPVGPTAAHKTAQQIMGAIFALATVAEVHRYDGQATSARRAKLRAAFALLVSRLRGAGGCWGARLEALDCVLAVAETQDATTPIHLARSAIHEALRIGGAL